MNKQKLIKIANIIFILEIFLIIGFWDYEHIRKNIPDQTAIQIYSTEETEHNYTKKGEKILHKQKGGSYFGIEIPDKVTLLVLDHVNRTVERNNTEVTGLYTNSRKEIKLKWQDIDSMKRLLRHEIAHYHYFNTLKNYEKSKIDWKYYKFCGNEWELHASIVEDYGYFKFD